MATDTQLEAQRLVTISLTKMAQSRTQRTGISLHKSLLVATVLQKARYLCMEEVFRMVHASPVYQNNNNNNNNNVNTSGEQQCYEYDVEDDENFIALTAEDAAIPDQPTSVGFAGLPLDEDSFARHGLSAEYDKENMAPEGPTYFDLDKNQQCFKECSSSLNGPLALTYLRGMKRRRAICDSETEEAVQSILPKRTRMLSFDSDCDDSVFADSAGDYDDIDDDGEDEDDIGSKSMGIDRITSLVSIFSFGGITPSSSTVSLGTENVTSTSNIGVNAYNQLTRSSSTPDLCSAQAKESDSLQQRTYIAMTV